MTAAPAPRRFMLVAGAVLAVLFVLFVFRPAVERGGIGEFGIIAIVFAVIVIVERWIRSR